VIYLTYVRPFSNLIYHQAVNEDDDAYGDFLFDYDASPGEHASFEREDQGEMVSAWQGGHTKKMSLSLYGVNSAYPVNLQPQLLADYWHASRAWHGFLGLDVYQDGLREPQEDDMIEEARLQDGGLESEEGDVFDGGFLEDDGRLESEGDDVFDGGIVEDDEIELAMHVQEQLESDNEVIDPEPEDPEPWMRHEEERGMQWMAEQNARSTELSMEPAAPSEIEEPIHEPIHSEPPYVIFEDGEDLYGMPCHSPLEPSLEIPQRQSSPEIPPPCPSLEIPQ